ncbi:MAG: hypothetical protein ABSB01_08345 [Streptosporangiaceae bacterium]|jgi:hypothetical protein
MPNRFTKACYAMAAGVAVTAAIGLTAAGAASASTSSVKPDATPPCGYHCINPYTAKFGPGWVLQNYRAINAVGNPLKLQYASNTAPGQDWTIYFQGSVNWFYHHGLVSARLALHYGHEPAYELQWSPYGVNTGLCQGTSAPAANGRKVNLQECGDNANTVWVLDFQDAPPHIGFVPVIAGSTTNFSQPQVLTAGTPPTEQLYTYRIHTFADGSVANNQLWWAFPGMIGPAI